MLYQVFQKIQLLLESNSKIYVDRVDREMFRFSCLLKSREFKKQRRDRKEKRSLKIKQLENREGKQYESGLGFRKEFLYIQGEIFFFMILVERRRIFLDSNLNRVIIDLEIFLRGK